MFRSPICRICLAVNLRFCNITGTPLQLVFEQLTNTALASDGLPTTICYVCRAQLSRSLKLKEMAAKAQRSLTDAMEKHSESLDLSELISAGSLRPSLCTVPVDSTDSSLVCAPITLNYVPFKVKDEPLDVDEFDYDPNKVKDELIEIKEEINELYNDLNKVQNEPIELLDVDEFDYDLNKVKDEPIELKEEMNEVYNNLDKVQNEPIETKEEKTEDCNKVNNRKVINVNGQVIERKGEQLGDKKEREPDLFRRHDKRILGSKNEQFDVKKYQGKDKILERNDGQRNIKDATMEIDEETIQVKNKLNKVKKYLKHVNNGLKRVEKVSTTEKLKGKLDNGNQKESEKEMDSLLKERFEIVCDVAEENKKKPKRNAKRTIETLNSAKMLLFLVNGEQRLITFTLPKESCTLQDVLSQVGITCTDDTLIQCLQDEPGCDIDYFVSVGGKKRLEELLENHPALCQVSVGPDSQRPNKIRRSQRIRSKRGRAERNRMP